ncbi:hypothetical protein BKA65DRAFT_585809 [Rhexocercosporidium sp. MPI-PUGE-AT-0058]|nr:hypothetical protein BKA65DRAFT_585809 [Rhexocercosporidium sp. MPI-PUGE-AT-0058]
MPSKTSVPHHFHAIPALLGASSAHVPLYHRRAHPSPASPASQKASWCRGIVTGPLRGTSALVMARSKLCTITNLPHFVSKSTGYQTLNFVPMRGVGITEVSSVPRATRDPATERGFGGSGEAGGWEMILQRWVRQAVALRAIYLCLTTSVLGVMHEIVMWEGVGFACCPIRVDQSVDCLNLRQNRENKPIRKLDESQNKIRRASSRLKALHRTILKQLDDEDDNAAMQSKQDIQSPTHPRLHHHLAYPPTYPPVRRPPDSNPTQRTGFPPLPSRLHLKHHQSQSQLIINLPLYPQSSNFIPSPICNPTSSRLLSLTTPVKARTLLASDRL